MIFRYRWPVLLAWVAATTAIALLVPAADTTVGESGDLLPADTPVHVALAELAKHFGDRAALSDAVIVFERADGPLTPADRVEIENVGRAIAQSRPGESLDEELHALTFRTPAALEIAGKDNPLISSDGRAALISISLPFNFISKHAARFVKHAQEIVGQYRLPPGLSAAVTGSAGYGYDYSIATERSHRKTTIVTLVSVILILLLIYRAPLAAMLPLAGISMAALVVLNLLTLGERIGLHNGLAERIFTFVLLYGAGIDYSLLFISRYREFLGQGRSSAESIALGFNASLVAIWSSTIMTVSGLAMLCFSRFSVFRDAGPAVMLAMLVAATAATTLVPALLSIVGPRAFWPAGGAAPWRQECPGAACDATVKRGRFWPALAQFVVKHPAAVIVVTLAALMVPAVRGAHVDWNYDALFSLKSTYSARRGTEMIERHWAIGEIAPVTLLIVADQPLSPAQWLSACETIYQNTAAAPGVDHVRCLVAPVGVHVGKFKSFLLLATTSREYLSADQRAMRLSLVLNLAPLSREAMDDVAGITSAADRALAQVKLGGRVYLTGTTAEMIDVRTVTQRDFLRVAALALAAILVMVTALLRDLALSAFILAATVLSYLTTVGLTCWIFALFGSHGLEWKVQMLLFIVLVAVGQDYSIFFAVRFAQESRQLPCAQAAEQAVIFTGPVISSCGLIMAATLGSVMAGDVATLVQLGFALALGMLIDTFIVRPLLLPAFIVLTKRALKRAAGYVG